MASSRVTSKGQTTIPRSVRDKLRLRPGDAVDYAEENGRFILTKRPVAHEAADDPFASFAEWDSEADRRGYARL